MSRCHPQRPAKRTAAALDEAIARLNASEACKDAVACVVWWDMMSWHDGEPTPTAIMERVRREAQDVPQDDLYEALLAVGYCKSEARYRVFEVDSYYR